MFMSGDNSNNIGLGETTTTSAEADLIEMTRDCLAPAPSQPRRGLVGIGKHRQESEKNFELLHSEISRQRIEEFGFSDEEVQGYMKFVSFLKSFDDEAKREVSTSFFRVDQAPVINLVSLGCRCWRTFCTTWRIIGFY